MEYLKKNQAKLVWIQSDNGFWGQNKCGYVSYKSKAGVYTLMDAYGATDHCGPEKCVSYHPVDKELIQERINDCIKELVRLNEIIKQL